MGDDNKLVVVLTASSTDSKKSKGPSSKHPLLHLCMLGCEDRPPYGPTTHTATMFLNLLQQAADKEKIILDIKISIYRVQQFDYPDSYNDFDGVLLPGSFSAAYQEDEWIVRLKEVIRNDLWPNEIPTLGVCFGHQILAHALDGGLAKKCPTGSHAGCRLLDSMTDQSQLFAGDSSNGFLPLLYTHGDMVEKLPSMATRLGGTSAVPIQGAVYYSSSTTKDPPAPVFITFQAHPEYASEGPGQPTLTTIMGEMEERGDISKEERKIAMSMVDEHWETIYESSLQVLISTCRLFNWFPER